jgi:hypothetical protein
LLLAPSSKNPGKGQGHPRTGHEGPEGEYRYSSNLSLTSALDEGGWSTPRPGRFTPANYPVPVVYEAGWATWPVWTGAENFTPNGIRSPDRPDRSESLYQLSYPGPSSKNPGGAYLMYTYIWFRQRLQSVSELKGKRVN